MFEVTAEEQRVINKNGEWPQQEALRKNMMRKPSTPKWVKEILPKLEGIDMWDAVSGLTILQSYFELVAKERREV